METRDAGRRISYFRETLGDGHMEHKWMMIMMAVAIAAIMGSAAVSEYGKSNCQQELGKAGRSAEDIAKICR
jgi:hypothetical protein